VTAGWLTVNRYRNLFATVAHKIEITDKFLLLFNKYGLKIVAVEWALECRRPGQTTG
jgi:hypothetical protein